MFAVLQDIEPGLEQSEIFYSTTYAVLFASFALSAVGAGLLFNRVPTWHLLLVSTLSHTLGYTLYSLANSGWMMILARGLAGLQAGAVRSLTFSYFSLSFEKYTENLRTLGEFDKKRTEIDTKRVGESASMLYNTLWVSVSALNGSPQLFPLIPRLNRCERRVENSKAVSGRDKHHHRASWVASAHDTDCWYAVCDK